MTEMTLVLAAGGSIVDIDVTLFVQLGIFLTIWAVARWGYSKSFLKAIDARTEGIDGQLREVSRLESESDERQSRYETKITEARNAAARGRVKALADAERVERELYEGAEKKTRSRMEEARASIAKDLDKARGQLQAQAQQLAGDIAARVLGRKVA